MRDAIVFSSWSWETFNVPERVALALASQGSRVLYCEMPVSHFRRRGKALAEIEKGLYLFGPEYGGAKLTYVPFLRRRQWKMVAERFWPGRERSDWRILFLCIHTWIAWCRCARK